MIKPKQKLKYDITHPTTKYALEIIEGKHIVCKAEKLLAKKHLRDLKRQGTMRFPYIFDERKANRFFKFFGMCRNPDSAKGEYYKILPHQMFDFGLLFGWTTLTGIRKYKRFFRYESRGGAKTTGCSILAMYCMIADKIFSPNESEESGYVIPNVRVDLIAVDKKQVDELREPIVNITEKSPKIKSRINAKKTFIRGIKGGGKINVLSSDKKNKLGGSPNVIIADELGSWTSADKLIKIEQGLGKKAQYLMVIMTTAGDNEESNPAKSEYNYSKQVLRGEITDETYLPIIREVDAGDDIHDSEIWRKAAPMIRYCGEYQYADTLFEKMQGEHKKAFDADDIALQRNFKIYRLNTWQERAKNSYLTAEQLEMFDKLAIGPAEFNKLIYGRNKITGFDFAPRRDLTAYGDIYLLNDGRIAIDAHGYMLAELVKTKEITDRIPYTEWARRGFCTIINYPIMNKDIFIQHFLKKCDENACEIKEICYDKYKIGDLISDLMEGKHGGGFNENNCIEIPQMAQHLHIPTALLKTSIMTGNLVHNGNPLLRWCLSNCYEFMTTHGELTKVMKENKDSPRRIDLVAAIITAMARIDSLKKSTWVDTVIKDGYGF